MRFMVWTGLLYIMSDFNKLDITSSQMGLKQIGTQVLYSGVLISLTLHG